MAVLYLILLVLAAFCFILSTMGRSFGSNNKTLNLLPLGLLFWVLVPLISAARLLS